MKFTGSQLIEHNNKLMAYAYKRAGNRDTAQDLVQTTYMKAIRSEHLFTGDGNLGAWLMSILKNVINDYHWNKIRPEQPLLDDTPLEEINHPAVYDTYDDGSVFENEKLQDAYETLIPIYQDVVRFTWVDELTEEEMVEKCGYKKRTYIQRRFRAKELLKEKMVG